MYLTSQAASGGLPATRHPFDPLPRVDPLFWGVVYPLGVDGSTLNLHKLPHHFRIISSRNQPKDDGDDFRHFVLLFLPLLPSALA